MDQFHKIIALVFFSLFIHQIGVSQSVLINKDGGNPDNSAILELRSSEKGFLAPRMEATDRLSISSPATGLLVFQTNGFKGFYFYNGAAWDTLGGATNVTFVSNVVNVSSSGIAIIRDRKASGVNGGTFNNTGWIKRDLNTLSGDVSFVSLFGDSIVLDSGIYAITISAPAFQVDQHQIRLYNCTKNQVEDIGTIAYTNKFASSSSNLTAVIEVGNGGATYIIEHRCSTLVLSNGLGQGSTWSENVYTQVQIQKL